MSQSADAETLRFYDNEAEAYCQRTGALPSLDDLRKIFQGAASWTSLEIERSSGRAYDDAPVSWLNCFATK
ncbi:MAG: hypothetical protein WAK31_01790 [Chthoniobacterales bacterium]